MNRYIGVKQINAMPMTREEYNEFRGWLASQSDMLAEDWVVIP